MAHIHARYTSKAQDSSWIYRKDDQDHSRPGSSLASLRRLARRPWRTQLLLPMVCSIILKTTKLAVACLCSILRIAQLCKVADPPSIARAITIAAVVSPPQCRQGITVLAAILCRVGTNEACAGADRGLSTDDDDTHQHLRRSAGGPLIMRRYCMGLWRDLEKAVDLVRWSFYRYESPLYP